MRKLIISLAASASSPPGQSLITRQHLEQFPGLP
jgi:hypothetical protein